MILTGPGFSWHGRVGVENKVIGRETAVMVSGTELRSSAVATRLLLGIDGRLAVGRAILQASIQADRVGSGDTSFSGLLSVVLGIDPDGS